MCELVYFAIFALASFPNKFPSFDISYTNRPGLRNLLNTSGTLSDWCVHSLFLPFRITTVGVKGVCHSTSRNKDIRQ